MSEIKTIEICAKCSDLFSMTSPESDKDYDGYVPDFFPGQHYGDYVMLSIDVSTGAIVNWKKPSQATLKKLFK